MLTSILDLMKLETRVELTSRDKEVLEWVFRGYSNKEIAYELGIAESTIKNRLTSLYQKLGLRTYQGKEGLLSIMCEKTQRELGVDLDYVLGLITLSVSLTPCELDIVRLILCGMSNQQIAAKLGRAESTIKNRITIILEKCEVKDRTAYFFPILVSLLELSGKDIMDVLSPPMTPVYMIPLREVEAFRDLLVRIKDWEEVSEELTNHSQDLLHTLENLSVIKKKEGDKMVMLSCDYLERMQDTFRLVTKEVMSRRRELVAV